MKAYPMYDLDRRVVVFTSEDGREFKRAMNTSEIVLLNAVLRGVPGADKFERQFKEPVELVKKSCTLCVSMCTIHLKSGMVTKEDIEERREYLDIPGVVRPERVPVERTFIVND